MSDFSYMLRVYHVKSLTVNCLMLRVKSGFLDARLLMECIVVDQVQVIILLNWALSIYLFMCLGYGMCNVVMCDFRFIDLHCKGLTSSAVPLWYLIFEMSMC